MNKNYIFLLTTMLLSIVTMHGVITVNDRPLNDILEKDQNMLIITPHEETNFFTLILDNGNIQYRIGNITNPNNLQVIFDAVWSKKNQFASFSSKVSRLTADDSIDYSGIDIKADDLIMLTAQNSINVLDGLFDCKETGFMSNEIKLTSCFLINSNKVSLEPTNDQSNFIGILIIFHDDSTIPTLINGHIDFTKNSTPEPLLLTNVKNVAIVFNESALSTPN